MAPNARFWRTYNDKAVVSDAEVLEQYKDTIDVLLVFAGLFSAVVTVRCPGIRKCKTRLCADFISAYRRAHCGTTCCCEGNTS